jgi:hypothetical protein
MVKEEVVIEFNKFLIGHTGSLWKIAGGLVVIEILIIAHTLVAQKVPFRRSVVACVLSVSAAASVASLVCGYFADAAALASFQVYAAGGAWAPSKVAEWLNLWQMIWLTIAFIIFVVAFISYSLVLADGIVKTKLSAEGK